MLLLLPLCNCSRHPVNTAFDDVSAAERDVVRIFLGYVGSLLGALSWMAALERGKQDTAMPVTLEGKVFEPWKCTSDFRHAV